MIPLIRPVLPNSAVAETYLKASREARQFANFGPCYAMAEERLRGILGGHSVLTTSGTAAIELALKSLNTGSRVLIPDYTHIGTLIAAGRAYNSTVLAGVDPMTWQLRHADVAKADVDAVVVVNPFGYGVDTAAWDEQAEREGFDLVYDFAGAWTSGPIKARNPVCLSLHATKNLAIGEGGIVWFPDSMAEDAAYAKRLSNFDIEPDRRVESQYGMNAKMDELHCAYLLAALDPEYQEVVTSRIATKRLILSLYQSMLPGTSAPRRDDCSPSLCVLGGLPATELEASAAGAVFRRYYYPVLSDAFDYLERVSVSPPSMRYCCALPSDVDLHEAGKVADIVRRFL